MRYAKAEQAKHFRTTGKIASLTVVPGTATNGSLLGSSTEAMVVQTCRVKRYEDWHPAYTYLAPYTRARRRSFLGLAFLAHPEASWRTVPAQFTAASHGGPRRQQAGHL